MEFENNSHRIYNPMGNHNFLQETTFLNLILTGNTFLLLEI